MNLKSFKALQAENPELAMIFDLTERYPRGPKAKLRSKHYPTTYIDTPESEQLIGGELGYDIYELYALTKKSFYHGQLHDYTTRIEGAAMGRQVYDYGAGEYKQEWHLFKQGPQITRRIRRLESRLRRVRQMMSEVNDRNLYQVHVGHHRTPVYVFGDSEQHAKTQYDLLLKAGFEAGAQAGYIHRGYGYGSSSEVSISARFDGPSHGPHEIMAKNQEFVNGVDKDIERLEKEIAQAKAKIAAAQDLKQLVNMFTINSCAQEFGDAEE
jgi:hypothetical protein